MTLKEFEEKVNDNHKWIVDAIMGVNVLLFVYGRLSPDSTVPRNDIKDDETDIVKKHIRLFITKLRSCIYGQIIIDLKKIVENKEDKKNRPKTGLYNLISIIASNPDLCKKLRNEKYKQSEKTEVFNQYNCSIYKEGNCKKDGQCGTCDESEKKTPWSKKDCDDADRELLLPLAKAKMYKISKKLYEEYQKKENKLSKEDKGFLEKMIKDFEDKRKEDDDLQKIETLPEELEKLFKIWWNSPKMKKLVDCRHILAHELTPPSDWPQLDDVQNIIDDIDEFREFALFIIDPNRILIPYDSTKISEICFNYIGNCLSGEKNFIS